MRPNSSVQLVANATQSRWSQAYSTLNLYVVLHVEGDDVARVGKDVLERLLREYFAQDAKNLESIKEAVGRVVDDIQDEVEYSLTLMTIIDSVAYIVVASCGKVLLMRDGTHGVVAEGKKNEVGGFSGHIEPGDILLVGTCDFFEKIDETGLDATSGGVNEIAETLAPAIHTESSGGEAGIVVKISGEEREVASEEDVGEETFRSRELGEAEEASVVDKFVSFLPLSFLRSFYARAFQLLQHRRREALIVGGIVLLVAFLGVLLLRDRMSQVQNEASAVLAEVRPQVNDLLENADAMSGVEAGRAVEFLREAKEIVDGKLSALDSESPAYEELLSLRRKIQDEIDALEGGERVELDLFFEDEAYQDGVVAVNNQGVFVLEEEAIARISGGGEIEDEGELDGDVVRAYGFEDFVYVVTDEGVVRVDGGNLNVENLMEDTGEDVSAFGNNAYLLSGDDVVRSSGGSYFESSPLSAATSLAIDGSVYIYEGGEIFKFLRGEAEEFEVQGLVTPFGEGALLYTSADLEDLYVLDGENSRVVRLSKEGNYLNAYKNEELAEATSFAVEGNRVFVSTPGGIFTFEM